MPLGFIALALIAAVTVTGCSSSEGEAKPSRSASDAAGASAASEGRTSGVTSGSTGSTAPAAASPTTTQGGSSAGTSSSTASAVAAANAICARRNSELAAVGGAAKSASLSKLASVAARRAAIEQRALGELGQLRPPGKIAPAWRQVLEYSDAALRQTARLAESTRSNDPSGVRSLSASSSAWQLRLLVASARSGLKRCLLPEVGDS